MSDIASMILAAVLNRALSDAFHESPEALKQAVHAARLESRGSVFYRQVEEEMMSRANDLLGLSSLSPDGKIWLPST